MLGGFVLQALDKKIPASSRACGKLAVFAPGGCGSRFGQCGVGDFHKVIPRKAASAPGLASRALE
jgi:hypothetical protein